MMRVYSHVAQRQHSQSAEQLRCTCLYVCIRRHVVYSLGQKKIINNECTLTDIEQVNSKARWNVYNILSSNTKYTNACVVDSQSVGYLFTDGWMSWSKIS